MAVLGPFSVLLLEQGAGTSEHPACVRSAGLRSRGWSVLGVFLAPVINQSGFRKEIVIGRSVCRRGMWVASHVSGIMDGPVIALFAETRLNLDSWPQFLLSSFICFRVVTLRIQIKEVTLRFYRLNY